MFYVGGERGDLLQNIVERNLIDTVVMGKKLGAPLTMPCTEKRKEQLQMLC